MLSENNQEIIIRDKLRRLLDLAGSDPAFYVLATHSFVESCLREMFAIEYDRDVRFPGLLDLLQSRIVQTSQHHGPRLAVLGQLNKNQEYVNNVRHRFEKMERSEAVAATYRLVRFCELIGIGDQALLKRFSDTMDLWQRSGNRLTDIAELNQKGFLLVKEKQQTRKLRMEVEELSVQLKAAGETKALIAGIESELEGERKNTEQKAGRVDELRARKWELEQELRKSRQRIAELEQAAAYVSELTRITLYTRTRIDYERSITRLTGEQETVLSGIRLDHDFLIKGGAGTGKTLVLLKALAAALENTHNELKFESAEKKIVLLTYTRTLAKYNRYITDLILAGGGRMNVNTANTWIYERFLEFYEGEIAYSAVEDFCKNLSTGFMDSAELAREIEDFIFGSQVSREEYVDEKITRAGRKTSLNAAQRATVWEQVEAVIGEMETKKQYSNNYVSWKLNREITDEQIQANSHYCEYIFIDEVQDLTIADLRLLRRFSRRCLLMSGDSDQAIYQAGFPFVRAGIKISGYTRILHTSFRNTIPVHALAETYRRLDQPAGYDHDTAPESFRTGPVPELHTAHDRGSLIAAVSARAGLLVSQLGYEAENICIIAPERRDLKKLAEKLGQTGLESRSIMDDEFDFSEQNVIRLSTMHSAKGLDFPVVLLYLPRLPYIGTGRDAETKSKIYRNLIYVAITRAMDYLNVFTLDENTKDHPQEIIDLIRCIESSG